MLQRLRNDARRLAVDALLVAVTLGGAFALARLYVGQERFFYYWDLAVHQDIALRTADAFRTLGLEDAFYTVYQTTADDYNAIFAVPLLPFTLLLGETRVAYVAGLALVYQVSFLLALGSVAAKLVPSSPRAAFWTTVAVGFATPIAWVPTLRGYPDAGAAALMALAVRLYLEDPRLARRSHVAAIGILLALAILFRRPFLFAVVALFAAMVVETVGQVVVGRANARPWGAARDAAAGLGRIGLVGAAGSATILILGHRFLLRILTHDFAALYAAYQEPSFDTVAWFVKPYGAVACGAAALGFVFGVRTRVADARASRFFVLFSVLSALQWLLVVRHLGEQYTLQFTPAVVLGCTLLGFTLVRAAGAVVGPPAMITATAFLACNVYFGLSGDPAAYRAGPLRPAFAANWPPLQRNDYDDVRRLVAFLRETVGPGEPVFVAASSHQVNPDLVAHAEGALFGRAGGRLKVLNAPAIDSRDAYPLDTLLQARYVVLVRPFQHHMRPEEQRVVKVVLDLFEEGVGLAQDFEPLAKTFPLGEGAVATIRRRARPTPDAAALRTLRYLREGVARRPGTQTDWVVLSELYPSLVNPAGPDTWTLLTHPNKRNAAPEARWLNIRQTEDEVRVTGRVHMIYGVCPGITLAFSATDEEGHVTALGELSRRHEDDGAFALALRPGPGRWLVMRALSPPWRDSIHACLTWLEDVRITGLAAP
jgi:hypothetical protein